MELTDKDISELTKTQIISQDVIYSLFDEPDCEQERLLTLLQFRADDLGILKAFNRVIKKYSNLKNVTDDDTKNAEMQANRASKGELYQREYIEVGKNGYTVLTPLLANYIKLNLKYIFARSDVKAGVQRYIYQGGVYRHVSDYEFKGFIKKEIPLELQLPRYINDTYSLLLCDTQSHTDTSKLNSNENIINFQNGLLNLDTMQLEPHTPDILTTIQIPCNYNPNATAPTNNVFDRFIKHLCYGESDRVQFLLEFMGVALSNIAGYRMKKALFMVGKGDTGKSQCKELINRLIGEEYFSSIELADLEERFGASSLYGKRVGGSNDMKYIKVNQLGSFKNLTGGDSIRAEYKGEGAFNFKYLGILWFCMNELPKFGGDHGDWVYNRIIVFRCDNPVPKKDPFLLDKMYEEREYIVNECVKAVRKLIDNGYVYDIPIFCADAKAKFKVENDSVLRFVEECTEPRRDEKYSGTPTTGQVYQAYKAWCSDNVTNGYRETAPSFKKILQSIEKGEVKKVGNNYYSKFVLTYEVKNQYGIHDTIV